MMKNKGVQVTIAMILLVLGLMLTVQFKSIRTINSNEIGVMRAEELQAALSVEQQKYKDAMQDVADKDKKIQQFEDAAFQNNKNIGLVQTDLEQSKMLAGLSAVQGPGVIVTLDDSKTANQSQDQNENYFIIHDSDILMVINELRASGAEAISLNDNRVLATSEIRCAGPALSINNTRTSVPFVIKAIGNPEVMENDLQMRDGAVDALQQWGIQINISKQDNLVVPKFDGVLNFKYAKPVSGD